MSTTCGQPSGAAESPVPDELLYRVVDALEKVGAEVGKTVPQVALNWLLQRPTVSSVVIGARDEAQLRRNLGAVGWNLTPAQVAELDAASATTRAYSLLAPAGLSRAKSQSGLAGKRQDGPADSFPRRSFIRSSPA